MQLINDVAARRDLLDLLPIPLGLKRDGRWVWQNRAALMLASGQECETASHGTPFDNERPARNFANQVVGEWSWFGHAWPLLIADDLETAVIVGAGGRIKWANETARRTFGVEEEREWDTVETIPRWRELGPEKSVLLRSGYRFRWVTRRHLVVLEAWPLSSPSMPAPLSMDHLASFVHEIRNPLAALSGYVEMAQRETSGSGHYYELMLEEIDRLSRLTADLLEVSRPLTLTLDWVLLDPLVEHAWFTATHGERSNGRSLSLVKRYAPEQELWADADRMQQVLTNIMKNAVEAMSHQGSQVEVSYRKQGDRACLTIRDDGPGISADVLKKLMFSRVTTKESGNGLGLMIVRRILEAHGGVVQLSSDQGTVVELVWPEPR